MSSGHDEYWSGNQRANVEAARDRGVNLAFFSGNEVFWKTRWEPSIDGSQHGATARWSRYKDTHFDAPDRPASTWTGTWRDPRFSPPADGGRPRERADRPVLLGELRAPPTSRCRRSTRKLRLWRNTAVASLASGQTRTLGAGPRDARLRVGRGRPTTGSGPPGCSTCRRRRRPCRGLHRLRHRPIQANATATHHLTLYRAPSGALVFGAGTVQWAWGLDNDHDRRLPSTATCSRRR